MLKELEMWQGPWNDDPRGPYYKIPCSDYRAMEAVMRNVPNQSNTPDSAAAQPGHTIKT